MTIPASMPIKATYIGDGANLNFPIPFVYFENTDGTKQIKVVLSDSNGENEVVLIENQDFSITEAGKVNGTLSMVIAPPVDYKLTIVYNIPIEQLIDWKEFGRLPSQSIENAVDKITAILKQIQEQVDRCPKANISGNIKPDDLLADFNAKFNKAQDVLLQMTKEADRSEAGAEKSTEAADVAVKAVDEVKDLIEDGKIGRTNTVYQRNIGDLFFTHNTFKGTKATGSLNGAYQCNGDEFAAGDFTGDSTPYDLLVAGKLPSVSYTQYSQIIADAGFCGFFALDTAAKKFKVPTITAQFLQAGTPGQLAKAGLPNISGHVINVMTYKGDQGASGALGITNTGSASTSSSGKTLSNTITFNASKSNGIYGASSTVQPAAVKARVMVQLANEIDNASSIESYIATLKSLKAEGIEAINAAEEDALSNVESAKINTIGSISTTQETALKAIVDQKNAAINAINDLVEEVNQTVETAAENIGELSSLNETATENIDELKTANPTAAENIINLTALNNSAADTAKSVTEAASRSETSATNAANSASKAAESATNATNSATAAQTSATAAESAKNSALNSAQSAAADAERVLEGAPQITVAISTDTEYKLKIKTLGGEFTSINLKGAKGDQGQQGDKGDKGDKGDTGAQGPKGDTGAQGDKGDKGDKGDTGDGFSIYKTYPSISAMEADAVNVPDGHFVLISSNVDDPDNARLYVKAGDNFNFLTDMSGAQGVKGDKGDTGEQGIQGLTGAQGDKGDKGDKGDTGERGLTGAQGEKGDTGDTGAHFTPLVDTAGNLSWTNNGGLENPATVNIKGPKGDKGDMGEQGIQGLTGAKGDKGDKGDTGERGLTGAQGEKGDTGDTGAHFTPLVDTAGNLSWTNNGGLENPATVNIKGPKGDKGDTGEQGIQGLTGAKGDKGDKGDTGDMPDMTIYQTPLTDLSSTSGTIALQINKIHTLSIMGDTTFSLPTPIDKTVFNQIKVMLNVTGSPTITWGTSYFFNAETPEIEAGSYDLYFDYDNHLNAWVAGAIKKGAA